MIDLLTRPEEYVCFDMRWESCPTDWGRLRRVRRRSVA